MSNHFFCATFTTTNLGRYHYRKTIMLEIKNYKMYVKILFFGFIIVKQMSVEYKKYPQNRYHLEILFSSMDNLHHNFPD